MRITFYGAARTVTGSQYLLETNGSRVLLECGLFQGRRSLTYERNRQFHFAPSELDAVLLSHAHIDHSGNLPNLVKQGCRAPIYVTAATASLADVMLRDSGHIQEYDAEFINKRRSRRGEPPVEPLYTEMDAAQVAQFLQPTGYNKPFEPVEGLTVEFFDAGHILGSAAMRIEVRENGRKFHLWFSGDIGRPGLPIIRDPVLPFDVDYLMMECTYGDTSHAHPEDAHQVFARIVKETVQRRGKVIIPAFAVGRTQDLVFTLNQMISDKVIPAIPVFVDSPLAVQASQVFIKHPECYDDETHQFIREERHPALTFPGLEYVRSVEDSKAINALEGPLVIISASGMAETGRILHHLKNNITDPRNTILIVSWQAPDTLGRRLQEGSEEVNIFGEPYRVRASVKSIGGLSAHADQEMLMKYALEVKDQVRKIILVHGESDAESILQARFAEAGLPPVAYPDWQNSIEI